MEINSKKLEELYKEWSGEDHTTNISNEVHDSSECMDFAEFCLKYAISEGNDITKKGNKLQVVQSP